MSNKIRYSPAALKDLDSIWDNVFEASKSFDITDEYLSGLMKTISAKKNFPESGIPLYYRGLFTGFYSVNFKAYKAFYRIRDEYIEILRVLLAKCDYMKKLFD